MIPKANHPRRERTHDWQKIKQYTLWPEQQLYEKQRTVTLFNESAAERARETGTPERTLQRQVERFEEHGMISLFPKEPIRPSNNARELPPDMRQLIVDLKTEYPDFRPHEIATICYVRFGRRPSHHTVQRVLASGPQPSITTRRFPSYSEIADGYERRCIVVRLHAEGWSVSTISTYMQATRATIYDILKRWAKEGKEGLKDRSHAPTRPARKVTFGDIQEVRRLARNPEIGAYRVMAALEQIGIKLSQRTCGRLLELNRNLYGLEKPKGSPRVKKAMPFKAHFRHQFWSVDVRYIEKRQIPGHAGPVYLISILENYSRAVLASKVSPTQNQWDYLEVLFAAFSTAGIPKAIVSDGGGIFYSNQSMHVYSDLGIQKERIDPKQAWQNYIETMFNIVRRMADFHFHQARSWEEMQQIHRKWVQDYNSQRHWAHESRDDGCHSPAKVMGWHKGTLVPTETLNRIFFATRYIRQLDRNGYIRFQDWRLYGERGLAHQLVNVWVYEGTLKLEHQAVTLSKYRVKLLDDRRHIKEVSHPRIAETLFRSPQMMLFDLGPDEWLLYWKAQTYAPRKPRRPGPKITQLVLFEAPGEVKAAGAETTSPFLRLVVTQQPKEGDS